MANQQRPVALITGAAKRVGACIAHTLHTAGYDLALHYRHSRTEAEALLAALENARPDSTLLLAADLADIDRLDALPAEVAARFGRLDALVNNASSFFATPLGKVNYSDWDTLFDSNVRGAFFLAQAAAPHLRTARGAIVNIVDIYAERPLPKHSVYSMAKAALAMMTQALAQELGPEIRVNGVAPGAVLWPESGKAYADQEDLVARSALKRCGSPEDIAEAVHFLIAKASFVTGQILRVDGGRSLLI